MGQKGGEALKCHQPDNSKYIWKVTVNGDVQTAYYIAARTKEEAIEKARKESECAFNCTVIEEDY